MDQTQLETDHGQYLRAEDGGGVEGALVELPDGTTRQQGLATGTGPDTSAWQTFTVERDGEVCYLKSSGDDLADPPIPPMYGCAENAGQDGVFVFRSLTRGTWEALIPHEMPDGRVAFEIGCRRGHYLCAEPDLSISIRQPTWEGEPSDKPGGYESFVSSYDFFNDVTAPPGSVAGPPLAGPVRVVGELFVDDTGVLLPIGCHFGEAFSAWTRGRQPQVLAQMRTIKAAGYDRIRTWLNLGYYDSAWHGREVAFTGFRNRSGNWVPATPYYSDHRMTFNRMLADVGIRGLFSRGDCNSIPESDIRAHLREERRILSHTPEIIYGEETANEKWQNFPPAIAEDEPKARAMMEEAFGGTGWLTQNSCPPGSGEEATAFAHMVQNWFTCQPVHGSREFNDMEKVLRRFFNYGYERYYGGYTGKPYAMESTEPGGPGQGVSVGNTSDLWKIMAMHAATLIGRSATIYMSGFGVFWDGAIESQVGFWEVPKLRTIFVKNAFTGQAVHGNRGEAWVTSNGGFSNVNPHGYARVDQLLTGDRGVAIAHHGGSGRALRFKIHGHVSIRNWDLTERMAFDVEPNAVRDVGGDGLVIMQTTAPTVQRFTGGRPLWSALGSRRA